MKSTCLVVSTLMVIVTTIAYIPPSHAAPTSHAPVRLEKGILINRGAGYYFAMPQGWVLDSGTDYEHVTVRHPESGAVFSVDYHHARGTPTMYYQSMIYSLESPDNKWLTFGKGFVKLGGREAMGFRGTRERDGKKVKELTWVALVGEYAFLLLSTVEEAKFDELAPQIDQIFSSFSWGTYAETP